MLRGGVGNELPLNVENLLNGQGDQHQSVETNEKG